MIKRVLSFSVVCILLLASHGVHGQTGGDHAFLWTADGGMQDLGVPNGYIESFANAISRTGHVAGYLFNPNVEPSAAVWTQQTGWRVLSKRLNPKYSIAYGINSAQQVVGVTYTSGTTIQHAFLWTAATGMQDLGTLGGGYSAAYGINEIGEVVGNSLTLSGESHAFLWTPAAGMQDLGVLNSGAANPMSVAYAINEKGVIVGFSTAKDGYGQAVLWENGGVHTLKGIGPDANLEESGPMSAASAINNLGQVAGSFDQSWPKQPSYPFLWSQQGGVINLGNLDGSTTGCASVGINNSSEIAGYCGVAPGSQEVFIWTSAGGLQSLGTMGGDDTFVTAINDAGQIVGYSILQ